MSQLSQICPVTDAEAERIVHPATFADLASRITASPAATADGARARPSPATSSRARRRWLIGAPLAAGLAVAVLLVPGWPARPSEWDRPARPSGGPGPHRAAGGAGTLVHHVRPVHHRHRPQPAGRPGPLPGRIAAHHLDITLTLVPASPSLVGTSSIPVSPRSAEITPITAQGKCYTGGGGSACPVGVRIPADFRGQAQLAFGRAARPGERYETTAPATAPGEVMHGMRFRGDTVSQVLAMLRERDVTVPVSTTPGRATRGTSATFPVPGTSTTPPRGHHSRSCSSSARPGRPRLSRPSRGRRSPRPPAKTAR